MPTSSVLFLFLWIVSLLYLWAYVFLLVTLYRSWKRTLIPPTCANKEVSVALLIPFRNEQGNIRRLLNELKVLVPDHWEVIFIDDYSEDHSFQLVGSLIRENSLGGYSLLRAEMPGKKAALAKGISKARAEIILTTDADIRLPAHNPWEPMLAMFADESVKLVAGPIFPQPAKGHLAAFQCYEWASVLLVTGAFFGRKTPLMCSGANLAFRKSAFREVGGYSGNDQLLSGDDEFLLKKMIRHFGQSSARYANTLQATVYFEPFKKFGELIQQRARWASKWNAHGRGMHYYVSMMLFFVAVYPLLTLSLGLSGWEGGIFFLAFWTLKLCVDYLVLGKVIKTFGQKPSLAGLLLTGALHPVYAFGVGWSIARGRLSWKGRKIK